MSKPDLGPFGYYPGDYIFKCKTCDTEYWDGDKRCINCMSCAMNMWEQDQIIKLLVCGGRDYGWKEVNGKRVRDLDECEGLCDILDGFLESSEKQFNTNIKSPRRWSASNLLVIHGNANGADKLAGAWARAVGAGEHGVGADWKKYGRGAGFIRNAEMLELKPDFVIAFPGGAGTKMMVSLAKRAGVPVKEIT
ncbi:MAG: hypothetical protein COA84_13790 [Robiginitomaculum sp.]|nr:MAG: hypothetical protein COA84_13790 [Robiginitomaculum sp.]